MAIFINPSSSGGGTPGGSDTQIQFNDGGAFGGDVDLTYDKTTNLLTTKGDVRLDDGGSFTTTIQCVTPTAARTISFPDATGTVALVAGSSGQLVWNNAGAYAGVTNSTADSSGNITLGGRFTSTTAGAASAPPGAFTGTWFTGGTATTTKPQVLIEPTGTTSTAWSTSGTGLGVNAASGFTGRLLDLQVNGTSYFSVSSGGSITHNGTFTNTNGTFTTSNSAGTSLVLNSRDGNGVSAINASGANGLWFQNGAFAIGVNGVTGFDRFINFAETGNVAATGVLIGHDANNVLAQRNGANAQAFRVYDTFTSSTDFHRIAIATARATLTGVSGASVTATALIPAGAVVMGVTSKVTTALGTANGTTGYQVGTAADPDRWGAITGTALGTTSDNRNWTAGTIECFPTATDVIVTATGGNFNGTGVIYLSVQYMTGQAD